MSLGLKPNWFWLVKSFVLKCIRMLLNVILSNILGKKSLVNNYLRVVDHFSYELG